MAVQRPSQDSIVGDFFYPLNGTENWSPPSLTTCDGELVSVLEVRIEPGDLNPSSEPLVLCFLRVVFPQCCVSSVLCFLSAVFPQYCVSSELCFLRVVFSQCCVSSEFNFLCATFPQCCVSSVLFSLNLYFLTAVFSRSCDSSVKNVKIFFYGQESPRGESTTTVCGVNYQLLTVTLLK